MNAMCKLYNSKGRYAMVSVKMGKKKIGGRGVYTLLIRGVMGPKWGLWGLWGRNGVKKCDFCGNFSLG
jgi:hypothetical protein